MANKLKITLKPGKEKAILNRHHWIFSGAIASAPKNIAGDILPVYASNDMLLGSAYYNPKASIAARMISFDQTEPKVALEQHLFEALQLRKSLLNSETNAMRLVNAEGDSLPGLIIDQYDHFLVMQISTLGMHQLTPFFIDNLTKTVKPTGILEKSESLALKEEGLSPATRMLAGTPLQEITIKENALKFIVQPFEGQKTGFFLDQREMRAWVKTLSKNKRVLNAFSYTGGFTVYALSGGAQSVDSIDISEKAVQLASRNAALNGFTNQDNKFIVEDVFQFLRSSPLNYDLIILDPPAFAKRAKDVIPACRGYKDINRLAMEKMPKNSLLLTCSCSYFVDENLFQKVLFQAAAEANRSVKIIGKHRQAQDHPVNIFHPEGQYLKSFLLYVS